jgi:hypothetical protein
MLFEFKKTLQQIHFITIAIKFFTKIISDAFEKGVLRLRTKSHR